MEYSIRSLIVQSIDLLAGNNVPDPELDARILLSELLGYNTTELFMRLDEIVSPEIVGLYRDNVQKRTKRLPLWYLLGEKEFMGLKFRVCDKVLIPRPETEILVEEVINIFPERVAVTALDIGTGCGNIAVSLAKYVQGMKIVAIDISEKALEIACENALRNEVNHRIVFLHSDLYNHHLKSKISDFMPFDIIVSNPPYISRSEMNSLQPEIMYEPMEALYGGIDGLKFYKWFAENVRKYLKKGGYLIVEVGYNQAEKVKGILEKNNLNVVRVTKDYSGHKRVITAVNG